MTFFYIKGHSSLLADTNKLWYVAKLNELKVLQNEIFKLKDDKEKFESNKKFISAIEQIAAHESALNFPFDSLKEISTLRPKDGHFILLTWNVPKSDETHYYFGFLMVKMERKIKKGLFKKEVSTQYDYYKLIDQSSSIKKPELHVGLPKKWFGMLYYQIIECDGYYTLLGWDGNDKLVQRKFIDVLYFKPNGLPVFGKDVFKFARRNPRRIMFEYSSEITMSLKYNQKANRIIYSHLGPREEGHVLEGLYQYYGPDGSYDSMYQRKGKWVTDEDVDARNPKNKNDNTKKPDPKKQEPIFEPK